MCSSRHSPSIACRKGCLTRRRWRWFRIGLRSTKLSWRPPISCARHGNRTTARGQATTTLSGSVCRICSSLTTKKSPPSWMMIKLTNFWVLQNLSSLQQLDSVVQTGTWLIATSVTSWIGVTSPMWASTLLYAGSSMRSISSSSRRMSASYKQ